MDKRKLEDFKAEELRDLPYEDICRLRRRAFKEQAQRMKVPSQIQKWVEEMTKRYGPKGRIWVHTLPWLEVFMVVRYGEDPMQWPPEFSEADIQRAETWFTGGRGLPPGLKFIEAEEE